MMRHYKRSGPFFAQGGGAPAPRPPRNRFGLLSFIKRTILGLCTIIGAFVLISILLTVWGLSSLMEPEAPLRLPEKMVLAVDFDDGIEEMPGAATLSDPFGMGPLTSKEFIDALAIAKNDKRVMGVAARLDDGMFDLARVQELRAAIKDFRSSGKFAYLYSSSLGEMSGGLGRYLLARSFDQVWMQPLGVVSIPGVDAEMPFFRSALDKIGVAPQFFQRKEYKNAYESATSDHMSEASRASMQDLIDDMRAQIVADLSEDLRRPPQAIEMLVNKGLFTAQEAVKERLIDKIGYADELSDKIIEDLTGDPKSEDVPFVDMIDYARSPRETPRENPVKASNKAKIALIYAVGLIMPSADDGGTPLAVGEGIAPADEISDAIFDAAEDEDVEAIVLRIDSPGGSPVASEDILRALQKAQEEGKPVIVSMGGAAASGGYWIASGADRIFALPGTLTGSIGVVGGKVALQGLWDKLGVNWEGVRWGENSRIWSFNTPFSDSEAERINAMLDQVYDAFIERVSDGREMSPEAVEKVAKGHVWSGARAVELGLVDQLGGLNDALDYTAKLLSKKDRGELDVVIMPKPKTPFQKLLENVGTQAAAGEALAPLKDLSALAAPAIRQLQIMQQPDRFMTYEPTLAR